MPTRDLIATTDFSYKTRRLKAGDEILNVPERDAKVLIAIRKAREGRVPGKVAPPPARVAERAAEVTPAKPESGPVGAISTSATSTRKRRPRKRG